jgi:hypothetical protein
LGVSWKEESGGADNDLRNRAQTGHGCTPAARGTGEHTGSRENKKRRVPELPVGARNARGSANVADHPAHGEEKTVTFFFF